MTGGTTPWPTIDELSLGEGDLVATGMASGSLMSVVMATVLPPFSRAKSIAHLDVSLTAAVVYCVPKPFVLSHQQERAPQRVGRQATRHRIYPLAVRIFETRMPSRAVTAASMMARPSFGSIVGVSLASDRGIYLPNFALAIVGSGVGMVAAAAVILVVGGVGGDWHVLWPIAAGLLVGVVLLTLTATPAIMFARRHCRAAVVYEQALVTMPIFGLRKMTRDLVWSAPYSPGCVVDRNSRWMRVQVDGCDLKVALPLRNPVRP